MNKLSMLNEKIETTSGIRISPGYISYLANYFNVWLSEYRCPNVWKLDKIVTLNK